MPKKAALDRENHTGRLRMTIDLHDRSAADLKFLKEEYGSWSYIETIRFTIALAVKLVKARKEGSKILIQKLDGSQVELETVFF